MSTSPFSILASRPPLEHERFSAHRELEQALRKGLRGEVRFDLGSRALYTADASNYRQLPIGVVYPRDAADVEAALAACRAVGAAVLPRGAGTSSAGQSINVAVVLDYSRHMNALASIHPGRRLAVVEPGIVLDRLRDAAEVHHLTYAPDPATHSRCTLGGMIGNNSCGVHGLLGGKVVDNVESLDVILYDGTRLTVGPTSTDQLDTLSRSDGRVGQIYAGLAGIRDRYASLIRNKFPRIPRRVSGYNLDELLPETGFNVARALVGSEGTCVNVLSATLNLSSSPPCRVLVVLGFADAYLAADATPAVLEHRPIGLEGFDATMVDYMRKKGLAVDDVALLPPGGGFLLVELGAWDAAEAQAMAEKLAHSASSLPASPTARIYSAADAARIWHVRDSALGATVFVPGEPNGCEGWEDAAVPPEKLGAYLRGLTALMNEYGYRTPIYGHFGQGCAHLRPNFDFHTEAGIRTFREFIERAADLVLSFGGSLSGEHGDGQARAVLLPKMFGPELVQAFREFKALWDPDNRMNPGKLSDAGRVYDPIENLKHFHSSPTSGEGVQTKLAFAADNGSLQRATERCVGVGACRNTEGGVMCPSYRATLEEKHSTRGRAHLLWEMLAGALQDQGFRSRAVHEALDLCLSCKACKTECPVQVDMAAYKSEFLAQHYQDRLHPLQHYVFGFADRLAHLGSFAPALANALLTGAVASPLIKRISGVAKQRPLPRLAANSYQRARIAAPRPRPDSTTSQPVLLWPDTWNNYYHPHTLAAAESVLAQAGFQVQVPDGHICCGRPLYDFGFLTQARAYLANVLERTASHIDAGTPVIFLEPSCASVFKDELLELFPGDPRAARLSRQVWLLADWLAAQAPDFIPGQLGGARILVHGHCHHKAVFGGVAHEIALLRKAGATVEPIQAGCCGMAGPFGFEADKYEVSKTIAGQGLMPAVQSAASTTLIVADGFSCREQIAHLSHRRALHFAEILAHGCSCGS
ncbi:MAG TPA: FAD-binding and (Fe-S)-binding domain-containing protein [Terracidiphilus sp.]|nr:FAD-binding and (Fe-S)-binding domain-containing protein [Terracidiphilus sp.]